jgi:serine/threonine protein phosphatase 1
MKAQALHAIALTPKGTPTRHLAFLGDLIDRGPQSIRSVDLAMRGKKLVLADERHVLPISTLSQH